MRRENNPILVVDDDEICCRIIVDTLERAGYAVESTTDASLAVNWTRRRPYALLVSDVSMPKLSGTALVAEVRRAIPDLPAVLVTAFPDPTIRARARSLGVPLLAKPFETEAIVRLVERLLRDDCISSAAHD